MSPLPDPIAWYDAHAETLADRYGAAPSERVHAWLKEMLPDAPAAILDVGAGTGRDAAWLASEGYDVVAVEPASGMRAVAQKRYPDGRIQWIADSLPGLDRTFRTGLSFDVILLSAVWMHVAPSDRDRAFRKLVTLLAPGGLLAITLRSGPAEAERGFHPVTADEVLALAQEYGGFVEYQSTVDDYIGRPGVRWTNVAIRLPDDGTGALPLLRHIVLNDHKSSTYKLGLLRTLCRIADGAGGFAESIDDDHVAVPMGLVALTWIRLYMPLLAADLPQNPTNRGFDRLGFAKPAFRKLGAISHHDLRVGMSFAGDTAASLHQALKDVVRTIVRMPVRYTTYPNEKAPVFPSGVAAPAARAPLRIRLDAPYLASFGTMRVPIHVWAAIQRFTAWIEPAVIAEWLRVTKGYGERQGRPLDDAHLAAAMTWSDPDRDVKLPRQRADQLLAERRLFCVWSGKRLSAANLDIDHCFPWAAWPCGDLWNLMPAHRRVNQHEKRDRLPADALLRTAQERILEWWRAAYPEDAHRVLAERFRLEASLSLPGIRASDSDLDGVFSALKLQRLRLKQNQQIPEWRGERYL